jgi:hypothetical protein
MTNEEINLAIAEHCGWEQRIVRYVQNLPILTQVPDYCGDLNAMREAEETLLYEELGEMLDIIDPTHNGIQALTATAEERAKAFLKVKGNL